MSPSAGIPPRAAFLRQPLFRLLRQERGIAATEFGLMAPVFILLMMGLFDLGHMMYARAVFEGAVEKAARASSLETGDTAAADQMVENLVKPVLPGVEINPVRKSFYDFPDIDRPEEFSDENGNDICDDGEAFVDENRSGSWEANIGQDGNGGSSDVVMYTVTATYSPVFKVPFMPDFWNERSLKATAVKKNQPFGNQEEYGTTAGTCT
jgi:hypothetical protein